MQQNDGANENFLFCKCLLGRCICECYACDADVWTNTRGSSKIHCNIFIQKQIIFFNLEFNDHHQEFFWVRSIWCFKKFSSMSLGLFPKISQFDWKWDIWKLFLGLAHEFLTIEYCEKIFVLVNFKQIQCSFKSWT